MTSSRDRDAPSTSRQRREHQQSTNRARAYPVRHLYARSRVDKAAWFYADVPVDLWRGVIGAVHSKFDLAERDHEADLPLIQMRKVSAGAVRAMASAGLLTGERLLAYAAARAEWNRRILAGTSADFDDLWAARNAELARIAGGSVRAIQSE